MHDQCEWWFYADCYVEYIWVNIRCMLDWIRFFGMSAQLVSTQNETLSWLGGRTKWKFEATARLSIYVLEAELKMNASKTVKEWEYWVLTWLHAS